MNQEPTIFKLSNGMRVAYLYSEAMVSHLGVTIKAGSRFEKENEQGLAHFLEHCIFKGTKKRRSYHILSRLDAVGGELNAYTTKEEICVYASFTSNYIKRSSDLIADILLNSTFPVKEIEKEKAVIIDEINSYLDNPSEKIFDDFEAYLFPNNALGNNILGTIESVKSFTKKDLQKYAERFIHPSDMVLSFVGKIPAMSLIKILEKDFGQIKSSTKKNTVAKPATLKPFQIFSKESNYQSHIMIGGRAPGYESDQRRIFALLINILGGPALNSRLGLAIREKYGFTYNVEANYTSFIETGYWNIYASTDEQYQKKTIKLIHKELQKFVTKELTEKQLLQAKIQMKGQIALGMDSNVGLMLSFGQNLLIFDKIDTLEEVNAIIDSITAKEIKEVATKYFDTNNISTLIFKPQKEELN